MVALVFVLAVIAVVVTIVAMVRSLLRRCYDGMVREAELREQLAAVHVELAFLEFAAGDETATARERVATIHEDRAAALRRQATTGLRRMRLVRRRPSPLTPASALDTIV